MQVRCQSLLLEDQRANNRNVNLILASPILSLQAVCEPVYLPVISQYLEDVEIGARAAKIEEANPLIIMDSVEVIQKSSSRK